MKVVELWRHPVKSLRGERLESASLIEDGMEGDRAWAIRNLATGKILTARREPKLLEASARLGEGSVPIITLPDGTELTGLGPDTDAALTAWLGTDVGLIAPGGADPAQAEFFVDATDDTSQVVEWSLPPTRFVDLWPMLLITTASLRAGQRLHPDGQWDSRRFRPNVVVEVEEDGFVEDEWCGRAVRIGEVELTPRQLCFRCTIITRPQPGLERDLDIYRSLARDHSATFGVWSGVTVTGPIKVGDPVEVL